MFFPCHENMPNSHFKFLTACELHVGVGVAVVAVAKRYVTHGYLVVGAGAFIIFVTLVFTVAVTGAHVAE
jgi:hypothetical protein